MSAEFQVPSPLVPTRESLFVRYCKQYPDGTWAVIDVPLDSLRLNPVLRCRRRPSGWLIQEMQNGYSKIIWVEHVKVDDRSVHDIYTPLVNLGLAFGAKRWVATLDGQSERLASVIASSIPSDDIGEITTPDGRKNMLKLAERMVISFCGGVTASTTHLWTTLSWSGAEDVRVMTGKSIDDPGRPPGIVLNAATSFWLPVLPKRVFDFLSDESSRSEGRKINWMKAGILESNRVLTVSPYYAQELVSGEDKGVELDNIIHMTGITGIVNGMDVQEWDPQTDKYIAANYDATTVMDAKRLNKEALQAEVGLPIDSEIPVIIFIGRLEEQKGSDILAATIPEFIDENVQIIVLGTGRKKLEEQLEKLEVEYPDKARGVTKFNVPLPHMMIAGADYVLVPSRFEPCGLIQLQAMRNGTSDCVDDVAYAIMLEMSKLSYKVFEADVTRARNQLKSSLQLHLDGTSPVAEDIGRQLLTYGRRLPTAELFARIDAVDASTIKRVANHFIFNQDLAITAIGPIQKLPDYHWFRRRTYMLRYYFCFILYLNFHVGLNYAAIFCHQGIAGA